MELYDRKLYTEKLLEYVTKGLIIALTGQRRVGKSCIMRLIVSKLGDNSNNNIIYINKEKDDFDSIVSNVEFGQYVKERLQPGKENYLFVDEVQNILAKKHLEDLERYKASDFGEDSDNSPDFASRAQEPQEG